MSVHAEGWHFFVMMMVVTMAIIKSDSKNFRLFIRKASLINFYEKLDFSYEEAIKPREADLEKIIAESHEITSDVMSQIHDLELNGECLGAERDELFNELHDVYYKAASLEEQLLAIKEMKIVSLYKNIEILLKEMIVTAFPTETKGDLFKWDNMKTLFRLKGINFTKLPEYEFVNQLRLVNNNIKHSSEISSEIKKQGIVEFKVGDELTAKSLDDFYQRIKGHMKPFLKGVADGIYSNLFEFDDSRIEMIAKEYAQVMDDSTLLRLSKAIEKQMEGKVLKPFPM